MNFHGIQICKLPYRAGRPGQQTTLRFIRNNLCRTGIEDENQEIKESLGQLEKGLKSITAMLNRHGKATVYFGVSDDGDVCGLSIGKDTLMDIRNKIRDKIEPRIYAGIVALSDG